MRCADCKSFTPTQHQDVWTGAGHCGRWRQSYSEDLTTFASNEAWVESDEGWANMVGPDFGCVLFEEKS